jgi:hypothetical protein
MKRREFIQSLATTATGYALLQAAHTTQLQAQPAGAASSIPSIEGHTLVSTFTLRGMEWKVYEDLRTRDGAFTFISARGDHRSMAKSAEAQFPDADPLHLGLSMDDIGMSGPDLLADKLLAGGDDPDPEMVKKAAPPQGSPPPPRPANATTPAPPPQGQGRPRWDHIVGTKEAYDTMPVFPSGTTRTYHPNQYFPDIRGDAVSQRFDGLVGGWMPAVRKVMPISPTSYIEVIVFGDVEAKDQFIIQTWHRTSQIENGKVVKVVYGYSYPAFPPARQDPKPDEFYRALLVFANYWDKNLHDFAATSLADESLLDMAKHAFAKELVVRPNGVYPKYGAVDRDYYGSEYDGFQDIFTSSLYSNLEWGRFDQAKAVLDNYFTDFVDARGMINMRGPETAQFGMTLSLLARYYNYTRDAALIAKHRSKIVATAKLLADMHEESLKLPPTDVGYGIIHGWSESDACLASNPDMWWLPYFANNAFSARGLQDIGNGWTEIARTAPSPDSESQAKSWLKRAKTLRDATVASMEKDTWKNENPPYIGTFPGTKLKFRDSYAQERPTPQQWAHRPYSELLQADVLPAQLANTVIDCMRAYGATTIGVVANVAPARPGARSILGFISYGYAQMLLRLDRVEEYLLFLHAHRYHDHTRGGWTAGEVSGINGGTAIFCIPAQLTIPLLVRWMLVLEDSDDERLYFAKGVPRGWVSSGKPVSIEQAPTRWGRVSLHLISRSATKSVVATVELAHAGSPREIHVKLRVPKQTPLRSVTVNGAPAKITGANNDTVVIATGALKHFEVVGQLNS